MFSTIKKGLLATTMIVSAGVAAQSVAAADMVALLLPENVNPRWEQQDAAAFVRTMATIAPILGSSFHSPSCALRFRRAALTHATDHCGSQPRSGQLETP